MRRGFHTSEGVEYRELTVDEVRELARVGDTEALQELTKTEFENAKTLEEKVTALAKCLRLVPV